MGSPTTVLRYEVLLFLGALALIIFYQLLTGKINMRRLLFAKGRSAAGPSTRRRTSGLSPSRIQLLIVSIGVAIYLLAEALRDPSRFPEIPTGLLLILAGSEILYLTRKANKLMPFPGILRSIRRILRRSRNSWSR
ncbi:MAG: hypothetical protein IIA89_06505 [Chloroflexi bacterium]|nr:hypothetical protein [Chloroflexota bacterium]